MENTKRRKKTARFIEIAALAGVSVTTVDRVLNERDSTSVSTRARVLDAARQLGIPRLLPDPRHGLIHVDIVLPDNRSPFFQRLNQAMQRGTAMLDRRLVVHRISPPEDDEAALLSALAPRRYRRHGLIVAAPDTPAVRLALQQAQARGEHVTLAVTRVSGLDGAGYVGIDNVAAGRTAGLLLGRLCHRPGRVLLLSSRRDYLGHIERTSGCRAVLDARFAHLQCDVDSSETHDDPDRCYWAVTRALQAKGRGVVVGLYNSGAGSPGIVAALQRHAQDQHICWVTHELSDDHRQYLLQGALDVVIDQDPETQGIRALQDMLAALGFSPAPSGPARPGEFRLYLAENMNQCPRPD
ncbi:LacI family DNA-binding transcriptional regulator [Amphibiibacter pelophylacis]|uniref:LacI family DNA-binding transcriptional regulator n=1 Tax=Amphibiibacter pelophylacis TaxID=1799477 RepID=A0ACC6NY76_9BURK